MQELTAEGCLRCSYGRFECTGVAESGLSAVSFDLLLMDFQHFIQR